MALIAVAADKGAPGVSTASLSLAAVWPRPVLLAEADPAGGDLVYRFPAAGGGRLDPRRGLLSLAIAARRGIQPEQVWEHTQKLAGGLDVLTGVGNAEQAGGLQLLWGKIGQVLAGMPQLDVVADCGRLGTDGPFYDLLGYASSVVLVARPDLAGVVRLRDRVAAVAAALAKRGRPGSFLDVVIVGDYKRLRKREAEVGSVLQQGNVPGHVVGGLAYERRSAEMLRGQSVGKLDKSMLIRTAREIATRLAVELPPLVGPPRPGEPRRPQLPQSGQPVAGQPVAGQAVPDQALPGQPVAGQALAGQPLPGQAPSGQPLAGQVLPGRALPGRALPGQPSAGPARRWSPPDERALPPHHAGGPGQQAPDRRLQLPPGQVRPQPAEPAPEPPSGSAAPGAVQQHHDRPVGGAWPPRESLVLGASPPKDRLVAGPGLEPDERRPPDLWPGKPDGRWPAQAASPGDDPSSRPGQSAAGQAGRHAGPARGEAGNAGDQELREQREQVETRPVRAPGRYRAVPPPAVPPPTVSHQRPPAGPGRGQPGSNGRG